MLDFTKPITTRDGREVVILGTDFAGSYPVKGYLKGASEKNIESWTEVGAYSVLCDKHAKDLINSKARVQTKLFVNVYQDQSACAHETRRLADLGASPRRFACIAIPIDVEEGEGL